MPKAFAYAIVPSVTIANDTLGARRPAISAWTMLSIVARVRVGRDDCADAARALNATRAAIMARLLTKKVIDHRLSEEFELLRRASFGNERAHHDILGRGRQSALEPRAPQH